MVSSDNGVTWSRLFPNTKGTMGVFSVGTEFFINYNDPVAGGSILSSPDGITWVNENVAAPAVSIRGQFSITAGIFGFAYDRNQAFTTIYSRL